MEVYGIELIDNHPDLTSILITCLEAEPTVWKCLLNDAARRTLNDENHGDHPEIQKLGALYKEIFVAAADRINFNEVAARVYVDATFKSKALRAYTINMYQTM